MLFSSEKEEVIKPLLIEKRNSTSLGLRAKRLILDRMVRVPVISGRTHAVIVKLLFNNRPALPDASSSILKNYEFEEVNYSYNLSPTRSSHGSSKP